MKKRKLEFLIFKKFVTLASRPSLPLLSALNIFEIDWKIEEILYCIIFLCTVVGRSS